MYVNLNLIKELRDKTGSGISDCKKALEESNKSMEGAIKILRKKGLTLTLKEQARRCVVVLTLQSKFRSNVVSIRTRKCINSFKIELESCDR